MIANRSEQALQLRVSLLEVLFPLGPYCQGCGASTDLEDLEVDHPGGVTWRPRALNFLDRMRRYWRELDRGVPLRALCRSCNASDGAVRLRGRARYAAGRVSA